MKKYVVNKCLNLIRKYRNISNNEEAVIRYGLEGIYLTITKTIVILIIAAILGYFIESIIFTIIYALLRSFSFGIHAKKSWMCWISSIIIFVLIPIIAKEIIINFYIKYIIGIIGAILIFKNSPADTEKRPIVNSKRRLRLKITSTIIALIYFTLTIIINDQFISNCFIYSILLQNILISRFTYKLFNLPYNNYLTYLKSHPELNNL
ncbi:MAG: accessory gene regulator B family protein [Bacilli bacterium]|nr:accessory gene regulator B family protein [Bacilli bacterium]